MRRLSHTITLVILIYSMMSGTELWAKGGRGGPQGRGGGGFHHRQRGFTPSRTLQNARHSQSGGEGLARRTGTGIAEHGGHPKSTLKPLSKRGQLRTGDQLWSKDHARELQKLDHRKQVADHLRRISDQNGNDNLKRVARDMEQRAQSHYEKQVEKIKQKYGVDELKDAVTDAPDATKDLVDNSPGDPATGTPASHSEAADAIRKLTGRENALSRQVRNEERKLAKRMEAVDQMRQLAEQTNDNDMLQAADRLEEWAMDHFDQRMAQITDFQQRHDLPEVSRYLSP